MKARDLQKSVMSSLGGMRRYNLTTPENTLRHIQSAFRNHDIGAFQYSIDVETPDEDARRTKYDYHKAERVLHNDKARSKILNTGLRYLESTEYAYSPHEDRDVEQRVYCASTYYDGHTDKFKMTFRLRDDKWFHFATDNIDW